MSTEPTTRLTGDPAVVLKRLVRRWHCEWSINMPFTLRATWWWDKRLTLPIGLNVWLGWRRLSVWAMYVPNEQAHA